MWPLIDLLSFFFFSSRRRHTRCSRDWSSDVCSSDLFFSGMPTNNCPGFVPPTGGQCTTNTDCNGNGTGTGEGVCETGTGVCGCPSGETFFPQCGCYSNGTICQESVFGAGDFQCRLD